MGFPYFSPFTHITCPVSMCEVYGFKLDASSAYITQSRSIESPFLFAYNCETAMFCAVLWEFTDFSATASSKGAVDHCAEVRWFVF